jgi:hypothetical protein
MNDLKPCPFCGGSGRLADFGEVMVAECGSCHFQINSVGTRADEGRQFLADRWNRRAPRFTPEEREALEVAAGWCALKASMGSPTQWTTGHKTAAVIGKMLEAE